MAADPSLQAAAVPVPNGELPMAAAVTADQTQFVPPLPADPNSAAALAGVPPAPVDLAASALQYVVVTATPTQAPVALAPAMTPLPTVTPTPNAYGLVNVLEPTAQNAMVMLLCLTFTGASAIGILGLLTTAMYLRARSSQRDYFDRYSGRRANLIFPMRTFIAIELPDDVKRRVIEQQRRLQKQLQEQGLDDCVRWTAPANLHLTLRFLGDTTGSQRVQLEADLAALAAGQTPLALSVHALGCFPNFRRPTIVWLDFQGDLPALLQFQQRVEQLAQAAGFAPEDRAFTPHLTIGRAQKSASSAALQRAGELLRQVSQAASEANIGARGEGRGATADIASFGVSGAAGILPVQKSSAPAFAVAHVAFIHSDLQPSGPIYTVLGNYAFAHE